MLLDDSFSALNKHITTKEPVKCRAKNAAARRDEGVRRRGFFFRLVKRLPRVFKRHPDGTGKAQRRGMEA